MSGMQLAPIVVSPRFCGPPQSANGGYLCGRLAAFAHGNVAVRLRVPPPLDLPLQPHVADGERITLHAGDVLVAEALPTQLDLQVPGPITFEAASTASKRFIGFTSHPYGNCFVCGVQRAAGDGLRIFAGPGAAPGYVAAPWVPDASLSLPAGEVAPEFIWAALDCPGFFAASPDGRAMLLAEFSAQIEQPVRVDEPCVVMGWLLRTEGRKHEVGTALFGAEGRLVARARGLWIEPRRAGSLDSGT